MSHAGGWQDYVAPQPSGAGWQDYQPASPPPVVPKTPDFSQKVHDFLNSDVMTKPITINGDPDRALTHARDAIVGMLRNLYTVSAPNVGSEVYKGATGQPNQLKDIARTAVETFGPMMVGDEVPAESRPKPPVTAPTPTAAAESSEGMFNRLSDVAKRRLLNLIPGVKTIKDLDYILRGKAEAAPVTPSAPTPQVPEWYGKGQYGTPVSQWGTRISQPPPAATPAAPPESASSSTEFGGQLADMNKPAVADMSTVDARMRSLMSKLQKEKAPAPPEEDLVAKGVQSRQAVIDQKLLGVLNKTGKDLQVSLESLGKSPELQRFSPEEIEQSSVRLRDAGKISRMQTGGGAHAARYVVMLK